MGLGVFQTIPDFRDRCPLCHGASCAVRHGLYYRQVRDRDGTFYESFPVPRFRCRRRGSQNPEAVTFSVLPAELLPRRIVSLALVLWILEQLLVARRPMDRVLDMISDSCRHSPRPWFPETRSVYRWVHLFAAVRPRLEKTLDPDLVPRPPSGFRTEARRTLELFARPQRAPPVLVFHRFHFPRLLFALGGPHSVSGSDRTFFERLALQRHENDLGASPCRA